MSDVAVLEELIEAAELPAPERRSSSPCMAKLDRLTWATCDWFSIEGYRFGVRSTSHGFGEWVRYALGAYRADGPLDEDRDPLYALIVEDGAGLSDRAARKLHILYYGTWGIVRTLDVRAIARSFLGEIESLTFSMRDDAVYLEASVMRGGGKTILIPSMMIPAISKAGRRIQRSLDVALPAQLSVALDPATGALTPVSPTLDTPNDVIEALRDHVPVGSADDIRAFIDSDLPIDRVVMMARGSTPGIVTVPKGSVLFDLARSIRNLGKVGSMGVMTLGRALDRAESLEAVWSNTAQLIEVVRAAVNGGHYVPDRTEATRGEP